VNRPTAPPRLRVAETDHGATSSGIGASCPALDASACRRRSSRRACAAPLASARARPVSRSSGGLVLGEQPLGGLRVALRRSW
jgi:hypothetical protein